MIELAYRLESREDPVGWEHRRDVKNATRGQLLWYFFPGDITIRTDQAEWSSEYGWIPLFHIGLSLIYICERLEVEKEVIYDLTEADGRIEFHRSAEFVTIIPPDSTVVLRCSYDGLRKAAGRFARRLVLEISERYPSLRNTEVAAEMMDGSFRM